jgi:hypothetical protein
MVNLAYIKAIQIIHSKLSDSNIERYITGKTNLSLQGIEINPSHLGILIHDTDLDKFLELFSNYEKSEIIELENGEAKEFTMKVNDIDVMVCAEYPHGTYWIVMKNPISILIENMKIPCFSLESDRDAYIRLGMLDKAEIIDNHLKKQ